MYSVFRSVQFSRSIVSDSLRHHELQHARPPCPSLTPGVHSNSFSEFGKQQTQKCECLLGNSLCMSHRQMVVKTSKVKSSPCYKNPVSLPILDLSECHYNAKDTWVRNLEIHCASSFSFFFHHGFLFLLPE